MSGKQTGMAKVKTFVSEVGSEISKTTWPARSELIESTVVVIVSVILLAIYVGFSDRILLMLLKFIIPSG